MKKLLFILVITACALSSKAQSPNYTLINTSDDPIYTTPVEIMPEYKGGMNRFYDRLRRIQYLYFARIQNKQGKVMVSMVIEKDGSVSNTKIMNGFVEEQDKEILRVVNNLNKWKPGMHNGQPVRVAYNVPLNFKLVPIPARVN